MSVNYPASKSAGRYAASSLIYLYRKTWQHDLSGPNRASYNNIRSKNPGGGGYSHEFRIAVKDETNEN